jgi:hypothetical protein
LAPRKKRLPLTEQGVLGGRVILPVAGKCTAEAMLSQDEVEQYSTRLLAWSEADTLAPATAV